MTESLLYAEKAGLDLKTTIEVLNAGWAMSWGYINLAPRILEKDFETYFFIKHFVKDMWIALDECKSMNITLPWLELVYELYNRMMSHGEWDLWMQSLIIELKRMNNIDLV
jgi:3-hydroxyisobutyrate dehydrogenase